MGIQITILKETDKHETRVAASPDMVKKLVATGCVVNIMSGAGNTSSMSDADFKNAGAKIVKSIPKNNDVILCVRLPENFDGIEENTHLIAIANPYKNEKIIKEAAKTGVNLYAIDLMPRISRAQSMDVLSSQSNLSGYKAVLDAAAEFGKAFPMMMTAAGTIPPAKVFIMGAGVAGLQAIATAKRLGASVTATDVRPAAKEQVESLGGKFVAIEDDEFKQAETAGGYAKEMSATYKKKQAKLVAEHIAKQDIVITTALIPGRNAPQLIDDTMVKSMKPGSVLVDLAVEQGGNIAASQPGKIIDINGVKIIGHYNVPGRLAADASTLYARNLLNFLMLIIDPKAGAIGIPEDDEIIQAIRLTTGGKVIS